MADKRSAFNPFYVLLVVLGIAFTLTACAYVVMMLRALQPNVEPAAPQGASLLRFVDRHGAALMTAELLLLALTTVGAISTDRYWMKKGSDTFCRNGPEGTSHKTYPSPFSPGQATSPPPPDQPPMP